MTDVMLLLLAISIASVSFELRLIRYNIEHIKKLAQWYCEHVEAHGIAQGDE